MLSVVRPDHVVVVIEQDRASDGIGNAQFPYLNSLASSGLYYSNAHGVGHPSEPNTLALFSGSTQGITDNNRGYSFAGPNLAKSLFDAGLSFTGYSENLPADGSQVTQAGDSQYPDLYTRNLNAMAQFTNAGTLSGGGTPRPNSAINRTFGAFKAIPTTDYSSLPTVSYIVPNNLHSTHGSNEAYPWAGSPDETNNNVLRKAADDWLRANIDPYLQWARTHNSLLIITQDEERWTGGTAQTVTTLVSGDPDLFVPGTNPSSVNHYNVLRTIEEMYGLPLLNNTASASPLATDAQGRLAPSAAPAPSPTAAATNTALTSSANPSAAGQAVTFLATVTSSAAGAGTPAGTVTFKDGSVALGTVTLDANGKAALTVSNLAAGSHAVTAAYGGNASFAPSTSPTLTKTVNAPATVATSTSLASSLNPAVAGQTITFTATVTPSSTGSAAPTGSVTFKDGSTVLGTVALDASGAARLTTALAAGSHTITATYGGDAANSPSTSPPLTQQVTASSTAPANDLFENRIALSGTSATASGTNVKATRQAGEPRHAGNAGGRSVWWTWTAPASGTVTIDTLGSKFDTLLAVYTGTSVSALTPVASNDDAPNAGVTSKVSFAATAGRAYPIAVDGYGGASGSIVLRLTMSGGTTAAVAPTASSSSLFSTQSIEPVRTTILA